MKQRILIALMGLFLISARAFAQQKTVTGKVTSEQGTPLSGISVVVKGTNIGTNTTGDGGYSVRASVGQVLQFRSIGTAPEERTVGDANVINVQLKRVAASLDAQALFERQDQRPGQQEYLAAHRRYAEARRRVRDGRVDWSLECQRSEQIGRGL